jgi:hypothetical protein
MPAATNSARRRSVASAPSGLAPEGPLPLSRQVEITHGPGNCSARRVFPIPEQDRPSAPAHYEDRIWPEAEIGCSCSQASGAGGAADPSLPSLELAHLTRSRHLPADCELWTAGCGQLAPMATPRLLVSEPWWRARWQPLVRPHKSQRECRSRLDSRNAIRVRFALDRNVLPFDEAGLTQPLPECRDRTCIRI